MGKSKGYELLRAQGVDDVMSSIRKRGAASAAEIMTDTGRSRGNVDAYLRDLESGKKVVRHVRSRPFKGATTVFEYRETALSALALGHQGHGRGNDGGPHESGCLCTTTHARGLCASAGCVFCGATENEHEDHCVCSKCKTGRYHDDEGSSSVERAALPGTKDFTKAKAANVLALVDAGQLTFDGAVQVGLVPHPWTDDEAGLRTWVDTVDAPFSPLQVVPESRGRPIPAHPSVYAAKAEKAFTFERRVDAIKLPRFDEEAEAEGLGHLTVSGRTPSEPVLQQIKPPSTTSSERRQPPGEQLDRELAQRMPTVKAMLGAPFKDAEELRDVAVRAFAYSPEVRAEGLTGKRAQGPAWKGGYTHLTRGGDFELRDMGKGKVEVRRVTPGGLSGIAAEVDESFALANFIQKPASSPASASKSTGEVWVTPKPSAAQPPLPARPKALDGGHYGMGATDAQADAGEEGDEP